MSSVVMGPRFQRALLALLCLSACGRSALSLEVSGVAPGAAGTGVVAVAGTSGQDAGDASDARDAGVPRPALQNGQPCADASACASGFCESGVCCAGACAGPCLSCALPLAPGKCSPVGAGVLPPPRGCIASAQAACGEDGTCDGNGGCRLFPAGTSCGGFCDGSGIANLGMCDGRGTCASIRALCAPFTCEPSSGRCKAACANDTDCAPGFPCFNGICRRPVQLPCAADAECASGACIDGRCAI